MLLEVLQGFALRHVIRILFEVTKPELAILPVNIPKTFHGVKIQLRPSVGNNIVLAEPRVSNQVRGTDTIFLPSSSHGEGREGEAEECTNPRLIPAPPSQLAERRLGVRSGRLVASIYRI